MSSLTTTQESTERPFTSPPSSRLLPFFRILMAVLWTLAILTVCWLPGNLLQKVEGDSGFFEIPNLDKIVHWGIFAGFAVLWLRVNESRWRVIWVALAGIALAALTEIVQTVAVVGRDGDMVDFLTDVCGVVIGIATARVLEGPFRVLEWSLFRRSSR